MRAPLDKLVLAFLCAAACSPYAAAQTTALFTISSPNPAAASAGSGALGVSLSVRQNFQTTLPQQYGLCLYTGVASNAVARSTSTTASNPTFVVPALDFDIPPASFTSGQYTAYLNLQVVGASCTATSALSNSLAFSISYPTVSTISLAALPQPNSGVAYASYPTNLEVSGANLNSGSGAAFTFSSQTAPGVVFQAGTYLPASGSIVVPLPAVSETGAPGVTLSACNTSLHYRYCSAATSLASFPLASTTTQLTSSVVGPMVGQSTTLTATIVPGPGSTTPGGIYAPGPPSGLVTFTDGSTTLGTAPLIGSSLTFAAASPQTISAPSKSGFRIRGNDSHTRPNDTPTPANSTAFSSILADFNLDGVKDALILDANSGNFHLLLGASPTGNFQPERLIASGCSYLSGAATADLNGDGFPDIAYLCLNDDNTAALFALYNLGDGTFGPATAVLNAAGSPLLQYGDQIGAGDVNKDGKSDLVVTGPTSATAYGIQTFLGDGAGHFVAGPVSPTSADPGTQLVLKDLNNDGAPDLVLLNSSSTTYTTVVQPYLNNGSGVFTASTAIPVCSCFTYTAKLFVTPLTANTLYPDIAVAAPDQQQTLVALNQHTGALTFTPTIAQSIPHLADAVVGDLNADGLADLVYFDGASITALNGDGAGNFVAQSSSPSFSSTGYSAANVSLVAAADLNQDGYADLVTIYPGTIFTSAINTYLTTGTAVASLPATFSTGTTHALATSYLGNVNLLGSNGTLSLTVTQLPTVLTYTPVPATIRYGTPLVAAQFDAVATTPTGATIPGAFTYNHSPGDVLSAGLQTLTTTFIPADASFQAGSVSTILTVTRATPTINFSTPPTAVVGTQLSTLQLTPTVTGIAGVTLPGVVTFTPTTGLVTAGPQTLNVTFTPTDISDYKVAATTVTLSGIALTLSSLSSSTAQLGDPAKTITLTGTGFVANSVARANGSALATTFVNATTLNAVLPAANFLALQSLQITVFNPTQNQTTAALPFTIVPAPLGTITFTGPATANSGDQPIIHFALTNPYPVDLTATLTLTFAPLAGTVDDPAIQFRNGGRTFTFNLTAGQTISPTIQLQSGTVAGTIEVSLAIFITNGNINVTPTSVAPILITIPPAPPVITSMTVTRTGRQLTVNTYGLSNTRVITQAAFHFTAAAGQQIQTQDIPLDVTTLFSGWYTQTISATYGSTFLYTQTFTLDEDATVVGQVTLILSNGVGASASGSSN